MKKTFLNLLLLCLAAAVNAQTPDIRLTTNIYQTDGPTNAFTLILGAAPGKTGYADIRCSGGNQSEAEIITAYYSEEAATILATNISCQVDEQGVVEVFLDEGVVIDYIYCEGAELTGIEVKNPETIEILALEHNKLESLDLTAYTGLTALYLKDNPFDKKALVVGDDKPELRILDLSIIDNIDIGFDITTYPKLQSFIAYSTPSIVHLNPSGCPDLLQLSLDNTSVTGLDLRMNEKLRILNISESRIQQIDLSSCSKLEQFYATHTSSHNTDCKLEQIDVTCCPNLIYLALSGNNLTSIDLSKCPYLTDLFLSNNKLTELDLSSNPDLVNVYIQNNYMDFNTLPIPKDTWSDYNLDQRPLSVPTACLAGSSIDLSSRLVRSDSQTFANLFSTNENDPELTTEIDPSLYTFENGMLTVHEALTDSIYASFYNGTYPDTELRTTKFMVKDNASYGKPNLMATLYNMLPAGTNIQLSVGLSNAKVGNQKNFFVDLGDGNLKEFHAVSTGTPAQANVVAKKTGSGAIKIYMEDGEALTALKIENIKLTGVDLSNAAQIEELTLTNTKLTELDLQWNRLLKTIDITGNNFGAGFSLAGANGGYGKNLLYHINLSNNNMTEVKLNEPGSWQYIDLSHNMLSDVNFTDADYVKYLDVSHNNFEYLKINYLWELKTFYCNDNKLSELVLPETNVIETFNCANNCFTLANMPERNGLDEAHFTYAPQAVIEIPSKGPGYNLSSQNVIIDGKQTVYTWKTTEGETLTEGADYTIENGVTHFKDNTIGKTLYCELTNASYPALSGSNVLKTTAMLSAGMPTHLLGEFTTPQGGQEVRVSLASAVPNNSLYIDWTGTNSLEQYPLGTTYTLFSAKTTANARVKVWSYDEDDNLTVFSLTNAKLADVDLSPMKNLICLTLSNSGISGLKWPESPELRELSLDGCSFSSFDFKRYPKLNFVDFDYNNFKSVDLSGLSNLGTAAFNSNSLKTVKLGNNASLWQLALSGNQIETIDLSGAPNLEQVSLNNNKLSSIDLSTLKQLRVIYLDNNKFDFTTLPVPQEQWIVYTYGFQPELKATCVDGKVDLSSQAVRDGVETTYTWFYGYPSIDYTEGTVSGEELFVDEEYSINKGVTTFFENIDQVCCVLTNSLFPRTFLKTNVFAVQGVADGISPATAASKLQATVDGRTITVSGAADGSSFTVYSLNGAVIGTASAAGGSASITVPTAGAYIVVTNGAAAKILVK